MLSMRKKCEKGSFSFSLVSCSSFTVSESGKNASHPEKRWLASYLLAHTCTAPPPQRPYMPLLLQPMTRIRIGFQHARHFSGGRHEAGVHALHSGKHLLHAATKKKEKEKKIWRPTCLVSRSFFSLHCFRERRQARFQKAKRQPSREGQGGRKKGRKCAGSAAKWAYINWQRTQTHTFLQLQST